MAATGGVDEDNIELLLAGVGDGVTSDVCCVLAVALFIKLDFPEVLASGELVQISGVDAELFDGAGAEGVTGGNEEGEVVLEKEKG